MAAWRDTPELAHVGVAVNVSGRHLLSQTLHEHMVDLMAQWDVLGLDPARLTLEITETVLLNDLATAAEQLAAIRELGVGVAIDDYGTGFTSVTHLQQLPIDVIKIDRTFINKQLTPRDRALLTMITDLGHHLGVSITAEGVETVGPVRRAGRHRLRPGPGVLHGPPADRRRPPHLHPGRPAGAHPTQLKRLDAGTVRSA